MGIRAAGRISMNNYGVLNFAILNSNRIHTKQTTLCNQLSTKCIYCIQNFFKQAIFVMHLRRKKSKISAEFLNGHSNSYHSWSGTRLKCNLMLSGSNGTLSEEYFWPVSTFCKYSSSDGPTSNGSEYWIPKLQIRIDHKISNCGIF